MNVEAKTTLENGRHARPSQIRPVPPMVLLTKTNPVLSSADTRPWAVTAPFMLLTPAGKGFAIEVI